MSAQGADELTAEVRRTVYSAPESSGAAEAPAAAPESTVVAEEAAKVEETGGEPEIAELDDGFFRMWLVRHGEREDEVTPKEEWAKSVKDERFWDPLLTPNGSKQARRAAQNMERMIKERESFVGHVYASPLQRTVKTAEQVALHFRAPLHTYAGLSQCAQAMKLWPGGDISKVPFLPLREHLHDNDEIEFGEEERTHREFLAAVNYLVQKHDPKTEGDLVIVTHHEGIRRLVLHLGGPRPVTPYCCQAEFAVSKTSKAWKHLSSWTPDGESIPL